MAFQPAIRAEEQEVLLPPGLPGRRLTFCSVQLSLYLDEFVIFPYDLQHSLRSPSQVAAVSEGSFLSSNRQVPGGQTEEGL